MAPAAALRLVLLGALGLPFLAGCDTAAPDDDDPDPVPDELVGGVNLTRLFAAPTAAEEAAVRAEWAARDASRPTRYRYTVEAEETDGDGVTWTVLAGRDAETDGVLHYGLVREPGPPADTTPLPTILVCPEGLSDAVGEADALTDADYGFITNQTVQVIVAYRGETLRALGQAFPSPAPPDVYERDVDDALALLDAALALPRADEGRVGAYGFGRGAAVALVAAVRSGGIEAVADLAGASDFLSEPFRAEARAVLRDSVHASDFPGIADLAGAVLFPLRDGALSYGDARLALLRRSAIPFADALPANFIAHGDADNQVEPEFSIALDNAIRGLRPGPPSSFLRLPFVGHDDLAEQGAVQEAVRALMEEHIRTP